MLKKSAAVVIYNTYPKIKKFLMEILLQQLPETCHENMEKKKFVQCIIHPPFFLSNFFD